MIETIGKIFLYFMVFPYVFRKISFLIVDKIFLSSPKMRATIGAFWGLFIALMFNFLLNESSIWIKLLGYASGLYCSRLTFYSERYIEEMMVEANSISCATYLIAIVAYNALKLI